MAETNKSENLTTPKNTNDSEIRTRGWQWIIFAVILLIGAMLRIGYISALQGDPDFAMPQGDMAVHDYWARAIVSGRWDCPTRMTENPHLESVPFLRPPGYPYFLALVYKVFGMNYQAPRVVQAVLGLISCVLTFFIGCRLIDRSTGLLWSAMMAVYWGFIYFEGELNAPVLLILLFLLFFFVLERWLVRLYPVWLCVAAILLGIAALCSPNIILIIPVVMIWTVWVMRRRSRLKRGWMWIIVFLFLTVGSIVPATIRNYIVAKDRVLISCNGAITLYSGNNEKSDGVYAHLPELESLIGETGWSWFQYPQIVRALQRQQGREMTFSDVSHYFSAKAWDYIKANPGQTAARIFKKALLFWGPVEIASNKEIQMEKLKTPVLCYNPGFSVYFAIALVGLFLMIYRQICQRKKITKNECPSHNVRWELGVLIFSFVVVYFMSFLPFVVSSRFRIPIVPFVLLASAFGIRCFAGYIRHLDWKSALLWMIITVFLFNLVGRPVSGYIASPVPWHVGRGEAYLNQGQLDLALKEFQMAIAKGPDYPRAYSDLALVLSQKGQWAEAEQAARKTIELKVNTAEIHSILAMILIATQRVEEGIDHYQQALQLAPDYVVAIHNLGTFYLQQRQFHKAIKMFQRELQLQPDNVNIIKILSRLFLATQCNDEAFEQLNQWTKLQPNDPEVYYWLAVLYQNQGKNDLAIQQLTNALGINPNFPKAQELLNALNKR